MVFLLLKRAKGQEILPTTIPYDEVSDIIQKALNDIRASGKFKCEFSEIDILSECDGFEARAIIYNNQKVRLCEKHLTEMLKINPNLKASLSG